MSHYTTGEPEKRTALSDNIVPLNDGQGVFDHAAEAGRSSSFHCSIGQHKHFNEAGSVLVNG